jgi:hypothetical protein
MDVVGTLAETARSLGFGMMKYRGATAESPRATRISRPHLQHASGDMRARPHVLLHLDLDHQAARSCTFSLRVIPPSSNRVKCPLSHHAEGALP